MHEDLLKYLSFHTELPATEWREFQSQLKPVKISKTSYLFRQGDPVTSLCWVRSGLLKTSYNESDGKQVTKGFVWESRMASPYFSILTKSKSSFSAIAIEEAECLKIDYPSFEKFYERHSCWQEIGRKMAEAVLVERENRIAQMLLKSAAERYRAFMIEFKEILDRIPQYEIASYLGVTPESLSRIRAKKQMEL